MSFKISKSTRSIALIVSRIEPSAPADLETRLLAQMGTTGDASFSSVLQSVRPNPTPIPIDLGRPADLTPAQSRLIETRMGCAAQSLEAACPLQPGEQQTAPLAGGLLSAPWAHLPPGTPIVTRTTNFTTVHMAWPNLRAENNELREVPPHVTRFVRDSNPCWQWDRPIPDNSNAHTLFNWITATLSAALAASGFAFLNPFLTLAGTTAFHATTLQDVFQIASCQAQKVSKAEDIEIIVNALSSMNQELQDTYLPAKKAIQGTTGAERVEKLDSASRILVSILTTNRNNLGMLSTDDLGFDGLVPYVAGASVVLSFYQELSTIDSSAATPAQSSFITSMHTFAGEAQAHVNAEVDSIRGTRSSAVGMVDVNQTISRCSGGLQPTCVDVGSKRIGATWTDQITGDGSGNTYTAGSRTADSEIPGLVEQCRVEMEKHRADIMGALNAKLKPLLDAAATFNQIPTPPALPA